MQGFFTSSTAEGALPRSLRGTSEVCPLGLKADSPQRRPLCGASRCSSGLLRRSHGGRGPGGGEVGL